MEVASRWLKANRWTAAMMLSIAMVYLAAIAVGLRIRDLSFWGKALPSKGSMAWTPPSSRDMPAGELGDSIRRGALLFDETPLYAGKFTHSKVACANCHAEGGIQPFSSPMVGLPATFPQFNQRAGHMISLKDRIQECFVRSENGTPLEYEGPEMMALVNYISWLSTPRPDSRPYEGRGLVTLPELKPDPVRGEKIYDAQCAGCHGSNGEGRAPLYPPLWGRYSFNDGAGMNGIPKMAAFVQHNMPQNRMGILSAQDAYDVASFVHAQPRPAFNQEFKHF